MSRPVIAVVGATASGKSDLGVELALALNGEVINADSMQLYRGMDIGTAKLTLDERRGVPHHLLDIWDVTQTASVADYQVMGRELIAEIQARGKRPILVGGSGLYLRAVLDTIEFPGTDPEVRARLEDELAALGPAPLHARLSELDPAAGAAILATNGRKIVRALEVVELNGSFTATLPTYEYAIPAIQMALDVPRDVLDQRIQSRVTRMWDHGLVQEVRSLADHHELRGGVTASRAIGYAQVLAMLDGDLSELEAMVITTSATRRYVRRQESWFRRDPRLVWLPSSEDATSTEQALDVIAAADLASAAPTIES